LRLLLLARDLCQEREERNSVVSAVQRYSSDEASSSGGEVSLRTRGVMREVRPSNESRKGMKEAAGLGEANMSASIVLRLMGVFVVNT
jgi:hypothetical protein